MVLGAINGTSIDRDDRKGGTLGVVNYLVFYQWVVVNKGNSRIITTRSYVNSLSLLFDINRDIRNGIILLAMNSNFNRQDRRETDFTRNHNYESKEEEEISHDWITFKVRHTKRKRKRK